MGSITALSDPEKRAADVYAAVIAEMRENFSDRLILVFGRDGEFLCDAYHAVATPEEKRRVRLIQASRKLVKSSSAADLIKFITAHGMNIEEIYAGRQKVLWFDTGSRGNIFNWLYGLLVRNIPESDPLRHTKLMNLFEAIEGRMIVSVQHATMSDFLAWMNSKERRNQEIADKAESDLYFGTLPLRNRERFGLRGDYVQEHEWLVANIEHVPKWRTRTRLVDSSGQVFLEEDPKREGDLSPERHMALQVKFIKHFLGARPWLIEDDTVPLVVTLPPTPPRLVMPKDPTEKLAFFDARCEERKRAGDEGRVNDKNAMTEEVARMFRDAELQALLLKHRLESRSLAHLVRRLSKKLPHDFLRKYLELTSKLDPPPAHLNEARVKCVSRLQEAGVE